jgi:hypothetical protein
LKALVVVGRKIEKLFLAEPAGKSLRLALNAAMPRPSEEISHEEMDKIDNHMAKTVPGFVDLDEGWRLNCIRLSILVHAAKDGDNPLLDALNGSADARLPSEAVVRKAAACLGKGYPSGKGLCTPACSGSWMYGVHRSSRSVSLARDLIHEMTSTVTVRQRAQDGSCIPPRKDFYQIWGDEPAVCAEHLTWWEYLRAGQAFARRRDRILPPGVEPAEIHKLSREMLMRCIEFAARNRVSRNITVSSKVTEIESERQALVTNLETAWMLAEQAVKEIVITVRNRSQQTPEATTQPA